MPYEADSVPLDGHPMLESFGLPGMVTPEPGGDPFLHPRVHTSVDRSRATTPALVRPAHSITPVSASLLTPMRASAARAAPPTLRHLREAAWTAKLGASMDGGDDSADGIRPPDFVPDVHVSQIG